MGSWVQWTARAIMLAAGFGAAGTGLSTAAFAQTGVDGPGPMISAVGSIDGGNQILIPDDAGGSAFGAIGNVSTYCLSNAAVSHGLGGDVLVMKCGASQSCEGHDLTWVRGSVIVGRFRCVYRRGPDAVTSFMPFILDSLSVKSGRPWGPPSLTGLTGQQFLPAGLASLSRPESVYGARTSPQAALSSADTAKFNPAIFIALAVGALLAGVSAVRLAGRRHHRVRSVRKGAMTL